VAGAAFWRWRRAAALASPHQHKRTGDAVIQNDEMVAVVSAARTTDHVSVEFRNDSYRAGQFVANVTGTLPGSGTVAVKVQWKMPGAAAYDTLRSTTLSSTGSPSSPPSPPALRRACCAG
jgi:hypothetical protein